MLPKKQELKEPPPRHAHIKDRDRPLRNRLAVLIGLVLFLCSCTGLACLSAYLYFGGALFRSAPTPPPPTLQFPLPTDEPPSDTPSPSETESGQGTVTEAANLPATGTSSPTAVEPPAIFAGFIAVEVVHTAREIDLEANVLVLGAGPEPVAGAVVALSLLRPDGVVVEGEGTSGPDGRAAIVFEISDLGAYTVSIVGLAAEGYQYTPELDLSNQFVVQAGQQAGVFVLPGRVQNFYERFNTAMAAGDAGFLLESLHPAVIERYGEAGCLAWLEEVVAVPRTVAVLEVAGFGVWRYATDGQAAEIEYVYTVAADVTLADGSVNTIETQVALREDASIGWFTDCGEPLAP